MKDYCKGREIVDGRTFEIVFWTDDTWGNLPWCLIYEIKLELRKKHWYSRQKEMREVKYELDRFWSCDSRLDIAREYIKRYLKEEKDAEKYRRQIEEFCNVGQ